MRKVWLLTLVLWGCAEADLSGGRPPDLSDDSDLSAQEPSLIDLAVAALLDLGEVAFPEPSKDLGQLKHSDMATKDTDKDHDKGQGKKDRDDRCQEKGHTKCDYDHRPAIRKEADRE